MAFEFGEFDLLTDGVIDLLVGQKEPADPARGEVPGYHYKTDRHGPRVTVSEIRLRVGCTDASPSLHAAGHVGREVDELHRGHRYGARLREWRRWVALAHGLNKLVISRDSENLPSQTTGERVGPTLLGTFDTPTDHTMHRERRPEVGR